MFWKKESYSYASLKNLDRLDTFIGRVTTLKADISTQGSIRIDGKLEGNINATEIIITGSESFIKGNINSKDAIISGRIEGNIVVQENVELQSGASILGDINCGNLVIGKNCFFEGKCHMNGSASVATTAKEAKEPGKI